MNTLSIRLLLGLALGLATGMVVSAVYPAAAPTWLAVSRPLGQVWLQALTMTVIPLVVSLLITGVARGGDRSVTARALGWFAVLLLSACAISALVATGALRLWPVVGTGIPAGAAAPVPPVASAGEWITSLIPANPIKAAAEAAVAPLVIFALLFGFAVTRIAEPLQLSLLTFFQAVVEAMLVIVRWVLWVGPIGVAALAFSVAAQMGPSAIGALLQYVALVSSICLLITVLAYGLATVAGGISALAFARAAAPAQMVALSTQSSLASLPAMIEAAPRLDVPQEAAAVSLPLAVAMFRASSAAANMAVVVYLAAFHGVALGPGMLMLGVVVTALVSLAAVGLPAQVSFFASIAPICMALGVPLEMLPILLAVETIPDIFRTVGNVTMDLAVTRILGRRAAAA